MSATMSTSPATSVPARTAATPRLSFAGVLRSEWIKLRTVRSTFWCYVIIVALTVLLALLIAGTLKELPASASHDAQQARWMSAATLGIAFSQLVVAVLGALTITGEYGTGMIRSTFAAVPRRVPAVVAKAVVFAVVTFVVGLLSLLAAALVTAPLLAGKNVTVDWGDPDVWLTLVGGAGYLALIGVIAQAIGLVVRNSAAGIATALALILVVPVIFNLLSVLAQADWAANIGAFLPSNAGGHLYAYPVDAAAATPTTGPGAAAATATTAIDLNSWESLLVVVGWYALAFVAGLVLLKRRDA